MNDDAELLRQYVEHNSQPAFAALVQRYVNLVYSAALRKTSDQQLARDASQIVFADLARKARRLGDKVVLAGWLYRSACFAASNLVRGESRRMTRERISVAMNEVSDSNEAQWAQIAPVLDDALNALGERDRDAVVLRFFEQKNWREVGLALGLSEDAAQKRVARALEKLRERLAREGSIFSSAALGTVITANAVQSAPVGLATSLAVDSLTLAASSSGVATILELMASTKLKTAASLAMAAGLIGPLIYEHRSADRLRAENVSLRSQVQQFGVATLQSQAIPKAEVTAAEIEQLRNNQRELLRLRGEVTLLRNEKAEWLGKQTIATSSNATAVPKIELRGRYIPREQWADGHLRDAQSALKTVLHALARKDEKRLKESTLGFYQPEGVTPRVVDSSMTMLLTIRIDSVVGYQILSTSHAGDRDSDVPGAIHWVSFVLQKEYPTKDKNGKPFTQQVVEKWPFQRTESGDFKFVPSRMDVVLDQ